MDTKHCTSSRNNNLTNLGPGERDLRLFDHAHDATRTILVKEQYEGLLAAIQSLSDKLANREPAIETKIVEIIKEVPGPEKVVQVIKEVPGADVVVTVDNDVPILKILQVTKEVPVDKIVEVIKTVPGPERVIDRIRPVDKTPLWVVPVILAQSMGIALLITHIYLS